MAANKGIEAERNERKSTYLQPSTLAKGLSLRAVVISLIVIAIVAWANPSAVWYKDRPIIPVRNVPSPIGVFLILILMLLNLLFSKLNLKRLVLSRVELITIFGMTAVGTFLSHSSIDTLPFVMMSLPKYKWVVGHEFLSPFYDKASPFLIPKGLEATIAFYLGNAKVPWNVWIWPIITWSFFLATILFVMICIVTLCRKHWNEAERLQYPLAKLTLSITEETKEGRAFGDFWKNKLVWIGILIPVIQVSMNYLHSYFPLVPTIDYTFMFHEVFNTEPWRTGFAYYPSLAFRINNPMTIGIGYLIPLQLSFSVWFFFLFWRLVVLLWYAGGGTYVGIRFPQQLITLSTRLTYGILLLYLVRNEIKVAFFKMLHGIKSDVDDSDEPLSYRTAVIGLIVGTVILILMSTTLIFARPWAAIFFFITVFTSILVLTRIRAELGLPLIQPTGDFVEGALLRYLPHSMTGEGTMVYWSLMYVSVQGGILGNLIPVSMEQYKMAEEVGMKRRSMTKALFIAFIAGLILSWAFGLPVVHEKGGQMTVSGYTGHGDYWVEQTTRNYLGGSYDQSNIPQFLLLFGGLGVGVTVFLMYMQTLYVWWPFHPVGYVLGASLPISWSIWDHIFIAWGIKALVLRYGGAKLYQKLTPFFMGMAVGWVIMYTFWSFIGLIIPPGV